MTTEKIRPVRFVRTAEAAAYTGLAKSTLEKLRVTGNGPRFSSCGRAVIYEVADLDAWIAANKRQSTSEMPDTLS